MGTDGGVRQKVLITGGSGTLGYNILKRLAHDERYQVVAPLRNVQSAAVQDLSDKVQFIQHDLSDAIHTAQIFERVNPSVIVHCAASGLRPPRGSWFELMQFNVVSTMRLFQMNCRLDHESHFIYLSTGLAYREQGRPLTEEDPIETLHPYGASKAASDLMLQAASAEFKRKLCVICDGGIRQLKRALVAPFMAKRIWNRDPFCVDLVRCEACGFMFYKNLRDIITVLAMRPA